LENDWIFIRPKEYYDTGKNHDDDADDCASTGAESAVMVEDPDKENLDDEQPTEELAVAKSDSDKPTVARRAQLREKRQLLKDLNSKLIERQNTGRKNLKRNNMVHVRIHSTRKNKQYGRMSGKHVGMVGKRGG